MPVMASDKRFSIVPNDQRDVAAVKHVADLLKTNMKELVLAAMWRGIREIIRDRDLLLSPEASPMGAEAIMGARSPRDLVKILRQESDDPTPYHPPPSPEDETLPPTPAEQLGDLRGRPQTRESKRGVSRLDKTGKKTRGRSEGIGG